MSDVVGPHLLAAIAPDQRRPSILAPPRFAAGGCCRPAEARQPVKDCWKRDAICGGDPTCF